SGKPVARCMSTPSKSRTVLSYSVLVRRRKGAAPGAIALHEAVSRFGSSGLEPRGDNVVVPGFWVAPGVPVVDVGPPLVAPPRPAGGPSPMVPEHPAQARVSTANGPIARAAMRERR